MENSNDKNKELKQDHTHPAPNADPGAEIETVIPNAEKTEASTETPDERAKPLAAEPNQKPSDTGDDTNDTDQQGKPEVTEEEKDQPEIKEEEKDEPEISENEEGESTTDEHGVETISP